MKVRSINMPTLVWKKKAPIGGRFVLRETVAFVVHLNHSLVTQPSMFLASTFTQPNCSAMRSLV